MLLLLASSLHAAPGAVTTTHPWAGGTRERSQPLWDGLPVLADPTVAARNGTGDLLWTRGAPPKVDRAEPPSLTPDQALALASDLANQPLGAALVRQAWLPDGPVLRPVFGVEGAVGQPWDRWQLWFDGVTGELLAVGPAAWSSQGLVYPSNPLESEVEQVTLEGLDPDGGLNGPYVEAWSCALVADAEGLFEVGSRDELEQLAQPEDGDYLYEPDPAAFDDPFVEVHLYHHVHRMAAWLDEEHGLDVGTLLVAGNLDMTNAFYGDLDGDGRADLAFGQSEDGVDFGYDADVAYHELGHGVVARTAGLGFMGADAYGMDWSPGALNEGVADVFAILLGGDGDMAAYAGTHSGRTDPIRELDDDRRCPDDLRGEVHADGEVLGAMAWNMVQDTRIGADVVADLFLGSLPTWRAGTSWSEAGAALLETASELAAAGGIDSSAHTAIGEHLEAANLPGCGRVVDLTHGEPHALYLPNLGLVDDYALVPAGTGFQVHVPADATSLVVSLSEWDPGEANGLGWTLMLRQDEPVLHETIGLDALGLSYATPVTFDHAWEGAEDFGLLLDAESTPALVPGSTLYLALAGRNDGGLEPLDLVFGKVTLQALYSRFHPRQEPNCACGTGAAGGWLLLPLLAMAARRRLRA